MHDVSLIKKQIKTHKEKILCIRKNPQNQYVTIEGYAWIAAQHPVTPLFCLPKMSKVYVQQKPHVEKTNSRES